MEDIGLLVSSLGENTYSEILNNNLGIYKGAIYENLIVDILLKKDYDLFYLDEYKGYEIDFVYKNKDLTNLLEVKSSNNRAKSLGTFVEKYKSKYKINPLKLISGNVGTSKNYLTLPL
jgi:predicted AAA+ superfamily ATPase